MAFSFLQASDELQLRAVASRDVKRELNEMRKQLQQVAREKDELRAELNRRMTMGNVAMFPGGFAPPSGTAGHPRPPPPVRCFNCQGLGHIARNCRTRGPPTRPIQSEQQPAEASNSAAPIPAPMSVA